MKNILQFGIPSLDALFGKTPSEQDSVHVYDYSAYGIRLADKRQTTSMCLIGPDGAGKSAFGLHLAAQYVADTRSELPSPRVLYVSTDLKHHVAETMWENFGLCKPNRREFPFYWGYRMNCEHRDLEVQLMKSNPTAAQEIFADVSPVQGQGCCAPVHFVDLVSNTMGDDWGFINRLLALLESPGQESSPHLLIIDAVEGFETLVGERDAFGETTSRRSRIAQIMRTAGDKCHIAFIVEEPKSEERFPEEFVTDVVIRLRNAGQSKYARRTVEVVKARGQAHIRGQHPFVIRDSIGSTTGRQENADDPKVANSYVHVFPSLHYLSRVEMRRRGRRNPDRMPGRVAAFGIRYLDEMLEHLPSESTLPRGFDDKGFPAQTITALIGEIGTKKTSLATAFLARTFRPFTFRLADIIRELSDPDGKFVYTRKALETRISFETDIRGANAGSDISREDVSRKVDSVIDCMKACNEQQGDPASPAIENLRKALVDLDIPLMPRVMSGKFALKGPGLVKFAAWLAEACDENGAAVLLTTGDLYRERLVNWFEERLAHSRRQAFEHNSSDAKCPVELSLRKPFLRAVRKHVRNRTICRRLEFHDMSSVSFFHVVQRSVERAQEQVFLSDDLLKPRPNGRLLEPMDRLPALRSKRFSKSWNIRVVIDDLSILKETYPDIGSDPLFLPFLLSYLELEGVTALVIDSQEGRPDAVVSDRFNNELRALVPHRLHTWRVAFHGEMRDAITLLPPFAPGLSSCVREVRWEQITPGLKEKELVVDPELELYSGLSQGEPRPIPLQIRLYQESGPFANYILEENEIFCKLFTPLAGSGLSSQVIVGAESSQYDTLWNFCNLQTDTRLDHTLIFQVDEFWAIDRDSPEHAKGPLSRRRGRLFPLGAYLTEETSILREERLVPDRLADPFGLFQGRPSILRSAEPESPSPSNLCPGEPPKQSPQRVETGPWERRRYFPRYRALSDDPNPLGSAMKDRIDRVPFTWDFGFLLCPTSMWKQAGECPIEYRGDICKKLTVKDVWDALAKVGEPHQDRYISWRDFLGACHVVAKVQAGAEPALVKPNILDIAISSGESFSCLILEIWASEILDTLPTEKQKSDFAYSLKHVNLKARSEEGLIKWLDKDEYRMAFYRSWLLLVDTIPFSDLVDRTTSPRLRPRKVDGSAVSTRHWYKTACGNQYGPLNQEPALPVRLPGHFSVRGDWFLALAGGSRSERLGRRALDLLSSRRANFRRMELGLGLPTRDISTPEVLDNLPTALVKQDGLGHTVAITYKDLTGPERWVDAHGKIHDKSEDAGSSKIFRPWGFTWLRRSQLRDYHRHSRLWQRWISQIIVMLDDRRNDTGPGWLTGFHVYDLLEGKNFTEALKMIEQKKLTSWSDFNRMCDLLIQELRIASRLPGKEPPRVIPPDHPPKADAAKA